MRAVSSRSIKNDLWFFFQDGHPHALLKLAGSEGLIEVECIIDTGFEGILAVSAQVARQLGGYPDGLTDRMLANGMVIKCPFFLVDIETEEGTQSVEAIVLGGNNLLGTSFFEDHVLHIEVINQGFVLAEPI